LDGAPACCLFAPRGDYSHNPSASKGHEVSGAARLLGYVQSLVDFTTQLFGLNITAQEDGLGALVEFSERLVGVGRRIVLVKRHRMASLSAALERSAMMYLIV